jgi:hypothetical protein
VNDDRIKNQSKKIEENESKQKNCFRHQQRHPTRPTTSATRNDESHDLTSRGKKQQQKNENTKETTKRDNKTYCFTVVNNLKLAVTKELLTDLLLTKPNQNKPKQTDY